MTGLAGLPEALGEVLLESCRRRAETGPSKGTYHLEAYLKYLTYIYIDMCTSIYMVPSRDLPFVVVSSTFNKGSAPKNDKIPQS